MTVNTTIGNLETSVVTELDGGRLFAIFAPSDGYIASHKRSARDSIKSVLKGIRDAFRPKPALRNYFPTLICDPASCDCVLIRFADGKNRPLLGDIFVNGKMVAPIQRFKHDDHEIWSFESSAFEPWENVVSLPIGWRVHRVSLAPAFKNRVEAECAPSLHVSSLDLNSPAYEGLSRAKHDSLEYMLRARNLCSGSQFKGTFFPAYDLDRRTYCLNSWVWCSAAVVKALVDEYRLTSDAYLLEIAKDTTDAMLQFQETDGANAGGIMVRWDFSGSVPGGVIRWLAPNDSAFVGAYALVEMYSVTGDDTYLKAAETMGDWIIREGMTEEGRLRVGYRLELGSWEDSWLYVDAGFCATLFDALFKSTNDEKWQIAQHRFMKEFIRIFYSGEGYFYRIWRSSGKMVKSIFARGQAWVLDGLLSAYYTLKEDQYLEYAVALSDFMLRHQNDNGSWNYLLESSVSGECNKGTPIMAYHLLRLYLLTDKHEYLDSAKRAIDWSIKHIYRGDDLQAYGGISAANAEGCISGVEETDTVFTYSSAYLVLAINLLENQVKS